MKLLLALVFFAITSLGAIQGAENICFVTAKVSHKPAESRPPEVWKLGLIGLAATSFLIRKRL